MLQSGETRKWVHFKEEENITYDVQDLIDEPEILSTDSIEVHLQLNKLIQTMENDIEKFKFKPVRNGYLSRSISDR